MPAVRNHGSAEHRAEGSHAEQQANRERTPKLAVRRGPWVLRSKVKDEFALAPSDLDSILPIEIRPNPYGKPWPMRKYNWLDVQDLANRLQPTFGSDERAQEDGEQIEREAAKQRFWASTLDDCQIDRIKPTTVNETTSYYNYKDVEDLKQKIRHAAAHPTGVSRGVPRRANYAYYEDDFNPFDGLSNDDADEWLTRLTGIVPHSWNDDDDLY